jgi:hypothetical protein
VFTDNVAFVPITAVPFDHEYVPPPVAVKLILVVVQVKTEVFGGVIPAVGMVMFCVMA